MEALVLLGAFGVLCALGLPVAYALGLAAIVAALYVGIPLEAEEGIVPADGEFPPGRITEVTWQEPIERPEAASRPGGGIPAGPGRTD